MPDFEVVRAAGVEPTTSGFGGMCAPFDLEFSDLISPLQVKAEMMISATGRKVDFR